MTDHELSELYYASWGNDDLPNLKGLRAVYRAGQDSRDGDPEELARRFHETYERLAPSFGYETRKASAVPWSDVPEQNKRLMIAVCAELFGHTTDKETTDGD